MLISSTNNFADDDHDKAYKLLRMGEILPLEQILKIARGQIQGRILEVELEHKDKHLIYDLEILDKKGIVWELKVDAVSGVMIKKEQD